MLLRASIKASKAPQCRCCDVATIWHINSALWYFKLTPALLLLQLLQRHPHARAHSNSIYFTNLLRQSQSFTTCSCFIKVSDYTPIVLSTQKSIWNLKEPCLVSRCVACGCGVRSKDRSSLNQRETNREERYIDILRNRKLAQERSWYPM
jgi:Zn ribbon nucleic-acid-binding protein